MADRYEPTSEFLKSVIAEEAPLSGSALADANMRQLIGLTTDRDLSNRDWATMLLASEDADTPEIRAALLSAANDENDIVRAEALAGIARRDRAQALPLVLKALRGEQASMAVFEAADLGLSLPVTSGWTSLPPMHWRHVSRERPHVRLLNVR
jgi:hypothetical protein